MFLILLPNEFKFLCWQPFAVLYLMIVWVSKKDRKQVERNLQFLFVAPLQIFLFVVSYIEVFWFLSFSYLFFLIINPWGRTEKLIVIYLSNYEHVMKIKKLIFAFGIDFSNWMNRVGCDLRFAEYIEENLKN